MGGNTTKHKHRPKLPISPNTPRQQKLGIKMYKKKRKRNAKTNKNNQKQIPTKNKKPSTRTISETPLQNRYKSKKTKKPRQNNKSNDDSLWNNELS